MAANNYRHSEDEYFRLRGQFDTGRITQEQFDAKLRELMVQDAQGRYWMLGADSGKWYYYDGAKWVDGDPYTAAASGSESTVPVTSAAAAAAPYTSAAATPAPRAVTTTKEKRGSPLLPILFLLLVIILGVAAFLLYQNRDRILVAQQPQQITPILPPTITRAPSPTPVSAQSTAAAVGTAVSQVDAPTLEGNQPPITVVVITAETTVTLIAQTLAPAEPNVTLALPTLFPAATLVPTVGVPPTTAPTTTPPPSAIVATSAPPPTNTALPNVPPDVYVTGMTISPNPAKRNQETAFTATFLNTTGGPRSYTWLILLYDPLKPGPNKQTGESPVAQLTVPAGESSVTINHIPVRGDGECIPRFARAGFRLGQLEKLPFPNTGPDLTTVYFDVCP